MRNASYRQVISGQATTPSRQPCKRFCSWRCLGYPNDFRVIRAGASLELSPVCGLGSVALVRCPLPSDHILRSIHESDLGGHCCEVTDLMKYCCVRVRLEESHPSVSMEGVPQIHL